MSDVNLLFKKYHNIAKLTNDLNNSVIILKRKNLSSDTNVRNHYPKLAVKGSEVDKAREDITFILTGLYDFLQKQNADNYLYELMGNQLFQNYILDDPEYKEQIEFSLKKLTAEEELTNQDLLNVDKFITILDNEASILYRKLRTTRA